MVVGSIHSTLPSPVNVLFSVKLQHFMFEEEGGGGVKRKEPENEKVTSILSVAEANKMIV